MVIIKGYSIYIESFEDLKNLKELVDTLNNTKKGGFTAWNDIPEGTLKKFLKRRVNESTKLIEVDYSKIKKMETTTKGIAKKMNSLFKSIKQNKLTNEQNLPSIVAKYILITGNYPTGAIIKDILDCKEMPNLVVERNTKNIPYPSNLSESEIIERCYFKLSEEDKEEIKRVRKTIDGNKNQNLNEEYTKTAIKNLMKEIKRQKIEGLQIIAEATQDFYKNNPGFKHIYNNKSFRPDALVAYKKTDGINVEYITIPCEVLSLFGGESYKKNLAEKIMDAAENYQYLPKVITSDKASSVEEAKEITLNALKKSPRYKNASSEEKVQYEWEATHNISVGKTNLDAIYDMLYMALDRVGFASKLMPKNKFDLFKKA